MGNLPHKKNGPENPGPFQPLCELNLFVRFVLNGLAGIFHVFAKPMGCMTAGEDNLAHDGNQNADDGSFQHFHF